MKYRENIIKWNLEKYNSNNELYNKYQVQMFLENANTHLISTFKDYLFYDDLTEFFSRFYKKRESSQILGPLFEYYKKSSYIFPNYTVLNEGKYVYKNIIKKQMLIDYLEDIEFKKNKNNLNRNKKEFIKSNNNEKIFDTQLYNNIIISNNSDLNLLFGINMKPLIRLNTKNNNKNNSKKLIENDSMISVKKLIKVISDSHTRSIGTNTADTSINQKAINNMKKRKNISPKEISNSTNYNSNISNINVNSKISFDKNMHISINNINAINKNIQNKKRHISNINCYTQKNLKMHNKLCKINTQKKMSLYLINFNSSFMKSYLNKIKGKRITSDKNVFHLIKSKNKNISLKSNAKTNANTTKKVLTPIKNKKWHMSKCSFILKDSQINSYLNHLPNIEHCTKINLKYKKIKINNNSIKNKNRLSSSSQTKSKFDIKLFENKYKKIINKNNYHRNQRNKKIITDFNLNNRKKNNESISSNNSIYKTLNMNNIKKSTIPLTHYLKNKKISLCKKFFKKDMNNLSKKNNYTKYISKRKTTPITFNDDETKQNSVKIITSYFNSKVPSPRKLKANILKYHFNLFHINKNNSLIKAYKTLHNSKYFTKKISNVINNNKK